MRKNTIINNVKKMVSMKYPKNVEKQRSTIKQIEKAFFDQQ